MQSEKHDEELQEESVDADEQVQFMDEDSDSDISETRNTHLEDLISKRTLKERVEKRRSLERTEKDVIEYRETHGAWPSFRTCLHVLPNLLNNTIE